RNRIRGQSRFFACSRIRREDTLAIEQRAASFVGSRDSFKWPATHTATQSPCFARAQRQILAANEVQKNQVIPVQTQADLAGEKVLLHVFSHVKAARSKR